jgi:hypothetical protein
MYAYLHQPSSVFAGCIAARSSTVAPLMHGAESKNRVAPVLNVTRGENAAVNSRRKRMRILGPSDFGMPDTGFGTICLLQLSHRLLGIM